jgi:hypothetical protein
MPKPASKQELLTANADAFVSMFKLIDSLDADEKELEFPFQHRDRNLRDVLAHLMEWQNMLFDWYQIGMSGDQPEMPAKGFSWKTTPELNQQIWKNCQSKSLKLVRKNLQASHHRLQELVQNHPDRELFTRRLYPWTGSTSLGVYLTAAGWSHYGWATKLIRKFVKHVVATSKDASS